MPCQHSDTKLEKQQNGIIIEKCQECSLILDTYRPNISVMFVWNDRRGTNYQSILNSRHVPRIGELISLKDAFCPMRVVDVHWCFTETEIDGSVIVSLKEQKKGVSWLGKKV
jgi:hypothetical protein